MVSRLRDLAYAADAGTHSATTVGGGESGGPPNELSALFATSHEAVLRGLSRLPTGHFDAADLALARSGPQPGFNPSLFFAGAGTCGGILDWEIVDFALAESLRRGPVASAQPLGNGQAPPPPLMYYVVLQNLKAWAKPGGPGLYLAFVKKYTWLTNTQLPFLTSQVFSR
jgi:hypothetical protein